MNADPNELQPEILDDFYSECDEHLSTIREALVKLEASLDEPQPDRELIEALFRSFHSFKGNSAIVGLRPAEALAHATEDILRDLSQGRRLLDQRTLELLGTSTQSLEQIIVAFRNREELPNTAALLEQVSAAANPQTDTSARSSLTQNLQTRMASQMEAAAAAGLVLFRFIFVPSPELDNRGINISSVRTRLEKLGKILHVAPQVRGKGMVAFELLAGLHEIPADLPAWEHDGITTEMIDASTAPGTTGAAALPMESGTATPFIAPSQVVRVDLKRLDELMRITGELVIQKSRFEQHLARSNQHAEAIDLTVLNEINASLSRSLRELREGIMRVRLVPVAEIFARMPFVVRDLARETNKQVRLKLEGQHTELDKFLIERLKDPILHLVRNSFAHGIEAPEARAALGKPETATISLSATTVGDSVIIEVSDDGSGIDANAVAARAKSLGIAVPSVVDEVALLEILCATGFSTRQDADRAAGRGVGMTVVMNTLRELGGTLALKTTPNAGTCFTLRLPLTLAVADTFVVSDAEQICAVPQGFVTEVLEVSDSEIKIVNRIKVIPYRNGVLPVTRLASLFNLESSRPGRSCALVLSSERGSIGLIVDRIHGQREVVVSPIRDPLIRVKCISGATELGDGKPVLILDVPALTSGAVRPPVTTSHPAGTAAR